MLKHLDKLPERTRLLFEYAGICNELSKFTLMGGTALTLHLGHRQSLDLDFAVFGRRLPTGDINAWVRRLQNDNIPVEVIQDQSQASAFKINTGEDLANFARDYEVAGVKVQFFGHDKGENLSAFYERHASSQYSNTHFKVLDVEGLKVAKTLVLSDRVRSRDLFDIMELVKNSGLTLDQMRAIVVQHDPAHDFTHYTRVMRGGIPLDKTDEGLSVLNLDSTIDTIYGFFNDLVDQWERDRAAQRFRSPDIDNNDGGIPSP